MSQESDAITLARLLCLPALVRHYGNLGADITASLSSPGAQALIETLRHHESGSKAVGGDLLDELLEESISKMGAGEKTIKISPNKGVGGPGQSQGGIQHGSFIVSAGKVCQTAEKVRPVIARMLEELNATLDDNKERAEDLFRNWLERSIVGRAGNAEPSPFIQHDPLAAALERLQHLKKTPLLYRKDEEIAFPLGSYALATKPKTPTGIEPFDLVELEGGAEEDTTLILSGESNIGKSHLGLFCLSSLSLRREAVLLCSGEDSLETTRKRIFAHYLRMPARDVIAMSERERIERFRELYGHEEDPESLHHHISSSVAIACIPEGNFTPAKITEKIDAFEQKTQKKIKGFMCDYLQKMNENAAGKKNKTMRDEELENTVNQIKDICQTRKTFGIIISQVPSHAAGGVGEFLNLKQAVARSYAATWGAHYVVTMNRTVEETRRLASAGEDKRPRLNLFLCKNKDGPLGVCYALGYPNEARWEFFRDKSTMEREIETQRIRLASLGSPHSPHSPFSTQTPYRS
jgi:hypothetical protein